MDDVRLLDMALRGPRPATGLAGLDRHFEAKDAEKGCGGCLAAWARVRPRLEPLAGAIRGETSLARFVTSLVGSAESLAGSGAWRGQDGRVAAELLAELQASPEAQRMPVAAEDAVAVLGDLLASHSVRPPYGGHPRVFIWGLIEGRLQQADLMILGGLNEGTWPALPAPDPWLAPKIRANLELPGLEHRIGLTAHDFASAVGARDVLITRAKREGRTPTVASRFLLRLDAISGGLPRNHRLERVAAALDDAGRPQPAEKPMPCPPPEQRPKRISVTSVDRLKADPFAFYAQEILRLRKLEPVDADHTAAWKGSAVHDIFEKWLAEDDCDPDKLRGRAEQLLAQDTIHPMLRALWAPRLLEAIDWMVELERENRAAGRKPLVAEARGEAVIGGVTVYGHADRIDSLPGGVTAIIDYKTGKPPAMKAIDAGFALQLGLLGLIGRAGGFVAAPGEPERFEYWSLVRHRGGFGKCVVVGEGMEQGEFLAHAHKHFADAAQKWLTGSEPFIAKLNPAYAPYGDYDQLMRLEEWYGRK
jgi:ATP-dependent helicase/nuclease subunit B